MDAAQSTLKKTALFLAIALLTAATASAQPSFVLTTNTVTLITNQAGHVTVTSSGATITFTNAITLNDNAGLNWLLVTSSGALTTPVTLDIGLGGQAGSLPSGTHTATILLTGTDPAGVANATITVSYTTGGAGGAGLITASPSPVVLLAATGNTVSQQVVLSTASTTPITFSAQAQSTGWLAVSINGNVNTVSSTTAASLTVQASAFGLPNAQYNGQIVITPSGGAQVTVPVQFFVGGGGGGGGTLTAFPNVIPWSYNTGGSFPFSQNILLQSSTGAGTYTATATSTNNWLLVNGGTYAPGVSISAGLFVSPSSTITSLATGSYTGSISVVDSNGGSTLITVNLSVNSGSSGGLTLSTSSVTLSAAVAGFQQQQTINVTSSVAGTLNSSVSTTSGGSWLAFTQSTSVINAGGSATVTVFAYPGGLSSGTYSGTLTLVVIPTVGGTNLTGQVQVTFVVGSGGGGTIAGVAPASLTFAYQMGTSPFLISPQAISITGTTGGAFTASSSQTWLVVSAASGTIPADVPVGINPSGLTVGTYNGAVSITTPNGVQAVGVTLLVTSSAVLVTNPGSLVFKYRSGEPNPGVQSVFLSTSDGSPLSFTASTTTSWLSVTFSTSGFSASVSTAGLGAGVYAGAVTITTALANSPVTFPVILVMNGGGVGGALSLGASSMTFNAIVNGAAPNPQYLSVGAAVNTNFTATSSVQSGGTNWLSVSPTFATTNTTLTVFVNQAGLGVGTYNGTLSLTANGQTQTVPVTLQVTTTGGTGGNVTVTCGAATACASLNFTFQVGGAAPAGQGLTVSNTTQGTASMQYSVGVTTQNGSKWLLASFVANSTPSTVTISVNTNGLDPNATYNGTVTITPAGGGAVVTIPVTLTVTAPSVSATPLTLTFAYRAGDPDPDTKTVQVSGGGASLPFLASASSSGNWLSVSPISGTTGPNPVNLSVRVDATNLSSNTYNGTITVSGTGGSTGTTTISVTLTVTAPLPTITRVANAASYLSGVISPGEIITIFGTNIGPATLVGLALDPSGKVATTLGGVQVLVNGSPCPMVYASSAQVAAVAPYEIAGFVTANVLVKFLGQTSNAVSMTVTTTVPGVFTANSTGTGPGAILNGNGGVNSPGLPADKGSTVVLFLTGEGQTSPAGVTGKVTTVSAAPPLTPGPLLPIAVLIDGQPANYAFAGEAPFYVSGVMQLNVVIPLTVRSGDVSVKVSIGPNSSQDNVTVSVR